MKVVILAGGKGTRITEESIFKPKPMIEIGTQPILWHIMKTYYAQGFNDFIICAGYKVQQIVDFFDNYFTHHSDVTFDMSSNQKIFHRKPDEKWKVTVVDTGLETMTGGRIKRIKEYIEDGTFCLTYGDGLSNINFKALIEFHKKSKKLATLTAIQPPGRFGALNITKEGMILDCIEKPKGDGNWINGGFFVLEPEAIDFIDSDETIWEQGPLQKIATTGQLNAYKHDGFWHCMDHLRDKVNLERLWNSNAPPWKNW